MTGILSSISGQFSKAVILGTLFPATVFMVLAWLLVLPLVPIPVRVFGPLQQLDPQWQVLVATFAVVLIGGLLYLLNIPITRAYEGYSWKDTPLGKRRIRQFQMDWDRAQTRWKGLQGLVWSMDPGDRRTTELYRALSEAGQIVNKRLPTLRASVLPTQLGNAIHSFEDYPYREYGIDSVALWPRVLKVVDASYAGLIDETKTAFDFMLNASLLSAVLAILLLLAGAFFGQPLRSAGSLIAWVVELLIAAELSYACYLMSVGRAVAWGELVKGVFDLYRWDLLKALGYTRSPTTHAAEIAFWQALSNKMTYGNWASGKETEYQASPTAPSSAAYGSSDVPLTVTRGVSHRAWWSRDWRVTMLVRNDTDAPELTNVVVTDTVPDGFGYEWGSARVDDAPATVVGTNPYSFSIGSVSRGAGRRLTYRMVQMTERSGGQANAG